MDSSVTRKATALEVAVIRIANRAVDAIADDVTDKWDADREKWRAIWLNRSIELAHEAGIPTPRLQQALSLLQYETARRNGLAHHAGGGL